MVTNGVTDMTNMFSGAINYNNKIFDNVGSVNKMEYMFNSASSFNQGGISSWAVSQVTSADYMFQNAVNFNQDLTWTPSSCKSFKYMFNQASRFDANIFTSTG